MFNKSRLPHYWRRGCPGRRPFLRCRLRIGQTGGGPHRPSGRWGRGRWRGAAGYGAGLAPRRWTGWRARRPGRSPGRRPGDFPRTVGGRAGVPHSSKRPAKPRRTRPGGRAAGAIAACQGNRASAAAARPSHSCQIPAASSQPQRSAACRVADPDRRPAQVRLEEAEEVLDGEAALVPAPQVQQVGGERAAEGQPQRRRRRLPPRQPPDRDPHHGELGARRPLPVQALPDLDLRPSPAPPRRPADPVGGAPGGRVVGLEDRAVLARGPVAGIRRGRAVEGAPARQAHQQVAGEAGPDEGDQVVVAVEDRHRPRRREAPRSRARRAVARSPAPVGVPARRAAPPHVQRQRPTARGLRDRRQPLVLPAADHRLGGLAARHHPAEGPLGDGLGRRPRPGRAVHRPDRPRPPPPAAGSSRTHRRRSAAAC